MEWFFLRKQRSNARSSQIDKVNISNTGIIKEQYVGSRRYVDAPEAPYQLPKDITDLNRLDFQHYIFRQLFAGNYLAPITLEPENRVLDVGCGTGRWPIEIAEAFPQVEVFGIDLEESKDITGGSPTLPTNYHFQLANVLKGLPFPDETFDFVHQRLLIGGIPVERWPGIIQELLRLTTPGGWIEMVESGSMMTNAGPATRQWYAWSEALMRFVGIDLYEAANLGAIARQVGLLRCQSHVYNIPAGQWGSQIGSMMQEDLLGVYDSLVPRYQKMLGVSPEMTDTIRQQMIQEWEDRHCCVSLFAVYGQKE
jgi:ubiquinone/menaquinone biosynthesis C-methylase UbiE